VKIIARKDGFGPFHPKKSKKLKHEFLYEIDKKPTKKEFFI